MIGLTLSLGLMGSALATLAVIFISERIGQRLMLVALAFLMVLGGFAFAFSTFPPVLIASALFGMVNGMGRDRGASVTLEQVLLPNTAAPAERTKVFAWYNVGIDSGHAAGAILGALPALFRSQLKINTLASYQWTWGIYTLLCLASCLLASGIAQSVESHKTEPQLAPARMRRDFYGIRLNPGACGARVGLSKSSRSVILRFAFLSGLDSLGGGFLTTALLGFWFFKRFGIDEAWLGPIFFFARLANIFSHLGAAWLAKRIGLIRTMVFTHLPSSLLLMTVPFMPNLTIAVILFLLRESLVEMDVPTRQSYIVAVVKPQERVRAAGLTNLTRGIAWGVGPVLAGGLSAASLSLPLLIGPALKVIYDLLLYRQFQHIKPPEEL